MRLVPLPTWRSEVLQKRQLWNSGVLQLACPSGALQTTARLPWWRITLNQFVKATCLDTGGQLFSSDVVLGCTISNERGVESMPNIGLLAGRCHVAPALVVAHGVV